MPGVTKEQVAAARQMTAIEFLRRYRADDLVKSSARGEFELKSHNSFKINGESSLWHWKSRGIGGKSALDYLMHVEGCSFVEAVKMLCEDDCLAAAVQTAFDLTPAGIITELDLQRPIYARTAVGGHFGREDLPWEKLDRTGLLMATLI